ncbi:MAG TPA: methyltransferase domain-containing protein [Solirubrobacteraceae bacterium]|nr:methyltransferase domain-containing protein [Solirubrobacteraceae bacterium]
MPGEPLLSCAPLDAEGPTPIALNEVVLYGWALDPAGIAAVEVELDGRTWTVDAGAPSPYLAEHYAHVPGHENAHFELRVDASGWSPGERELVVRALATDGREAVRRGPIEVLPFTRSAFGDSMSAALAAGEVVVTLDEPRFTQTSYQPVVVSGVAFGHRGVERVWVILDGRERLEATFPLMSAAARELFGAADAFSSGFRLMLAAGELPEGDHTIAVLAEDREGRLFGWHGPFTCAAPGETRPSPDAQGELKVVESPAPELREQFDPVEQRELHPAPEHLARYRWAASVVGGRTVLDAGCGVGWGADLLARAGAARVTGVDADAAALAVARERYAGSFEAVESDVLDLPFPDGAFDVVVCFEVIEHLRDAERLLAELHRVLGPDGALLLSSPNRGVYPPGNPFHVREHTSAELEAMLRAEFAQVRLVRQQTYVASLVGGDDLLGLDDPRAEAPLRLGKLLGHAPGEELYTLAVAGDGKLPDPEPVGMLGGALDVRGLVNRIADLEERLRLAEAEEAASRVETAEVTLRHDRIVDTALQRAEEARRSAERRAAESELRAEQAEGLAAALQASPSWRVTAPLRRLKRAVRRA